jgi:6-methylsalicylate decarboxylase
MDREMAHLERTRTAKRIDVHHHFTPPAYFREFSSGELPPPVKNWTPAKSIKDMDRSGVTMAMLSLPTPGVWFDDLQRGRRLARECNEYAAQLATEHTGRFGTFAAIPLPDTEGSLNEIAYALDVLKADGIGLVTSYDAKWLGDPAFAPVFEELDRRRAVVYVHPTIPICCRDLIPDVSQTIIEYGTDTTRTIASLLFGGAAATYQNIRFIFSHAGGTMPFLIERFVRLPLDAKHVAARLPRGVEFELQRFYYDTAQASNSVALGALLKVVPITQLLFGTDFPYRNAEDHVNGVLGNAFASDELDAIFYRNAEQLLQPIARL